VVESLETNAVVGIRRKNDPLGKIFTAKDIAEFENPVVGEGLDGTKGAVTFSGEGMRVPNVKANKN
jgi:hypothetical protein